eukprot:TRINITY_DN3968_c0_g2_i1.p1 TRINITY_DN3968_c0_g2~~TRINITY_DN3968_c0_g2_i1.p1  ORF type:complete len:351 (-),score=33.03 TRINITY_DN3968_c0_g2_i1:252-1304(-)
MADEKQQPSPFFYSGYAPLPNVPVVGSYAQYPPQQPVAFQPMQQYPTGYPAQQQFEMVSSQYAPQISAYPMQQQPMQQQLPQQFVQFSAVPSYSGPMPPHHLPTEQFQAVPLEQQPSPIMMPPNAAAAVVQPIADRLTSRDFQVTVSYWLDQSWELYRHNWVACVIFTLIYLAVGFVPYGIGSILQLAMYPGFLIAPLHAIRQSRHDVGNTPAYFRWTHLYHGIYWIFPIWTILFLYSLVVLAGFILLILPGLYFMITMSMAVPLYLEFRSDGLGVAQSLAVSHRMMRKQFCGTLWLYLATMIVALAGLLLFGVGLLVSMPVAQFMIAFALRDIFGASETRQIDRSVVCC